MQCCTGSEVSKWTLNINECFTDILQNKQVTKVRSINGDCHTENNQKHLFVHLNHNSWEWNLNHESMLDQSIILLFYITLAECEMTFQWYNQYV
jgi:hypothetical protein